MQNMEQPAVKLLLSQGVPEGHNERSQAGADREQIAGELLCGLLCEATRPRSYGAHSPPCSACNSLQEFQRHLCWSRSTAGSLCLCGRSSVSAADTESRLWACCSPYRSLLQIAGQRMLVSNFNARSDRCTGSACIEKSKNQNGFLFCHKRYLSAGPWQMA